ncbi:LacI family DNA-binding transcriptional regulator [Hoeflea prorocentri]|uniref:LacI family DNA-binding transcriptional regulator n=1 Tax=Hoeflea prorocentri TaxID=1922333 RepID=A0A9X3ZHY2_9HYPH|nr:LacI family DNA-binding transcriptional regulator [Hoeflea prorocentri]MCY6381839.1 LacI family DNA-binding transcriptional regulator [Hoeflea prorocentri]MDA5399639.1 LacI family DNA-binding transcriptional regulator [Hoeflea prorocentri]
MAASSSPTIKEVARLADVSVGTVSKVLNRTGSISEPVRKRVQDVAESLGYAPNSNARSLRSGTTRLLGLLVADLSNPFFLQLVEEIELLASNSGYSVLLYNSAEDPVRERRNIHVLSTQRVDGVLVIPTREPWQGRTAFLSNLPCPTVQVDRLVDGLDAPSVVIDNRLAGRLAAEHLADLGHNRIGVLSGKSDHAIARHRVEGIRSVFAERGVMLDETLIIRDLFAVDTAREATLRLMASAKPPTAIFSSNNHLTLGALQALSNIEAQIPQDISIIGVDELPWAGPLSGGLTAVVQPSEMIAKHAVDSILKEAKSATRQERHPDAPVVLAPRLIVRNSTCAPRAEP